MSRHTDSLLLDSEPDTLFQSSLPEEQPLFSDGPEVPSSPAASLSQTSEPEEALPIVAKTSQLSKRKLSLTATDVKGKRPCLPSNSDRSAGDDSIGDDSDVCLDILQKPSLLKKSSSKGNALSITVQSTILISCVYL